MSSQPAADDRDRKNAFTPTSIRSKNAYAELSWSLRQDIMSGKLKGGELLPAEADLAETWEVSRSTVREAVRTLQEAGLVGRNGHRARVVTQPTESGARFRELRRAMRRRKVSFAGLCETLAILEPQLTRLAATRANESDLRLLMHTLQAQEDHLDDVERWSALDEKFHIVIAEAAKNPALAVARIPIGQYALPALQAFLNQRPVMDRSVELHRRILAEIIRKDGEAAEVLSRQHVEEYMRGWIDAGLSLSAEIGEINLINGPGVDRAETPVPAAGTGA
jgi:GntR family transcriptional regulator, transcriptional repressor for pyruvate dehydrogenase complex